MALREGYREFVEYLNELHRLDSAMLDRLMSVAVPCNQAIAEHPSVQVWDHHNKQYMVRFLGVINGFFGTFDSGDWKGCGPVSAKFDDETGALHGFVVFGEGEWGE
jgi:hypothetical protein